jgi:glutamine---fructose-6-phosphate transaminase (isomerizing)
MEQEIREQPDVLRRAAPRYFADLCEALDGREIEMVLLAARGSSDHAALYARYLIEIHLGVPVMLAAPSVLTRYSTRVRYKNCLAIGISQSGAAPDVAEVLADVRDQGHLTLAITNTPGSRLTTVAEHSLLLEAGPEQSVAATKTYTASLLALYAVVRALGGDLPDPTPLLPTDEWMEQARENAEASAGPLLRSNPTFSLGRGYGFSTAQETALKLMECALVACKAYSTADFEHGPKALAGPASAAIVYGEPASGLEQQGCRIIQAPTAPLGDGDLLHKHETLRPLWDVIFGQWLALAAARAHGLNPDDPQHIQKVTETL